MKLRFYVEAEVSKTIAENIMRNGCTIEPDGSGMKIRVDNAPTIPKRKVKVNFLSDSEECEEKQCSSSCSSQCSDQ